MPNSLLEAFTYRKAVIAPNIAPCNDIINIEPISGLTFEYNNSQSLINAIHQLYMDYDKCAEYGNNGRKKIETIYSPDIHYAKLISIFQSTLDIKKLID